MDDRPHHGDVPVIPRVGERGASAIIVASALFLLMGFAAIAVDTGAAYDERRQQQGAVDTGLLSAAVTSQRLPTQTGCATTGGFNRVAACNGAMVAIDTVNKNLGTSFTATDFADTGRCPNSVFPSEYSGAAVIPQTTAGTNLVCIRYTSNLDKIRIVLPVTDVDTTFGKVIGRDTIGVSAVGEVEISLRDGGNVIPFIIGPTGAAANVECLFESSGGTAFPPCNGPDDGNFGKMQPYLYGSDTLGTTATCSGGGTARIAQSLAKGADHAYQIDSLVPGSNYDVTECPNQAQEIDYIDVQTGGSSGGVEEGLFEVPGGTEGRLRCKDGDSEEPDWLDPALTSSGCDVVNNNIISGGDTSDGFDSTPLWDFIDAAAKTEVPSCDDTLISNKAAMETCLIDWRAYGGHTTTLFTTDIASSPRFAWVPQTNIDPTTGGSGYYSIVDFKPVYLQTLFMKCNSNTCDIVHDPGEPSSGPCPSPLVSPSSCGWPQNGNKAVEAMTAMLLTKNMLPPAIANFPDSDDKLSFNLSE